MKAVNVNDVLKILYEYGRYIFVGDEKRYTSMVDEIANLKEFKQEPRETVFNETNFDDLRDIFCNAVGKVFGDSQLFLDFLENDKYSSTYDCYLDCNGENYIINGKTGEYINWYKFTHIGRCITISTSVAPDDIQKWIEDFLIEFKNSEEE